MNPVIERVARAIASSAAAAFGDRAIHYVENNWGAYTNQARAAIAALREPTTEVVNSFSCYEESKEEIAEYWKRAIDTLLKED